MLVKSTQASLGPDLLSMLEGVNYLDVEEERKVTRGYFVSTGRHIEVTVEFARGGGMLAGKAPTRFSL